MNRAVVLDKDQKKIVESEAENIVVVAGAGSGKTAVLTQRIRYLIEQGKAKPADIVAITFTNMAAEEMKLRLSDIEGIDEMFVGTIHSFANHLLKDNHKFYRVLSDDVKSELVRELIEKYCEYLTVEKFTEYENLVRDYKKGKSIKLEKVNHFFNSTEQYEYELITRDYNLERSPECVMSLCRKRNILTFAELIKKAKKYITGENRIKYLFVDEYQDVGNLEDSFIQELNAEHMFLVGDDWQSIYGFNGANVEIFKNYINSEKWETYHLDNNYRCASEIINLANDVIDDIPNRIEKNVVIKSTKKGKAELLVNGKEDLIAQLDKIKQRKDYQKWFILTRSRADLNKVLDLCRTKNIPVLTFAKADYTFNEMNEILNKNIVKVLTVHSAKGLESENVLLYGNFSKEFQEPKWTKADDYDSYNRKLEKRYEERRIMYVGVTRAKSKLVVINKTPEKKSKKRAV